MMRVDGKHTGAEIPHGGGEHHGGPRGSIARGGATIAMRGRLSEKSVKTESKHYI